jgi:hypothetical protein
VLYLETLLERFAFQSGVLYMGGLVLGNLGLGVGGLQEVVDAHGGADDKDHTGGHDLP